MKIAEAVRGAWRRVAGVSVENLLSELATFPLLAKAARSGAPHFLLWIFDYCAPAAAAELLPETAALASLIPV